jgi:hypothetical protein
MLTELLRAQGRPVRYLGSVAPEQLAKVLTGQRPLALLVGCTTACALAETARLIRLAHGLAVPVMVGGAAFRSDASLAALGAAAHATTAVGAEEILESWNQTPPAWPGPRELAESFLSFEERWAEILATAVAALGLPASIGPRGRARPQGEHDRQEMLLKHVGAALLVDDDRLFRHFLSWRSSYDEARDVSPTRLIDELRAIATAIPSDAQRAHDVVDGGLAALTSASRRVTEDAAPAVPAAPAAPGQRPVSAAGAPPGKRSGPVGMASPRSATTSTLQEVREVPGRVFTDMLFLATVVSRSPVAVIGVPRPNGGWSTLRHQCEGRDLPVDPDLLTAISRRRGALEITDPAERAAADGDCDRPGLLGIGFVYGIPLRSRQSALLGVLCVVDRQPRHLSSRERRSMTIIAHHLQGQLAARQGVDGRRPTGATTGGTGRPGGPSRAGPPAVPYDGEPVLLRSRDVAILFDVTTRTVCNWAASNQLRATRTVGGRLRFRQDHVLAVLAATGNSCQPKPRQRIG